MAQGVQQSILFLVQVIFSLYSVAIILRVMMRAVHADYYNPLVHAVAKITAYPIKWLKKAIPDIGKIETASVLFLIIIVFIKAVLVIVLNGYKPVLIGSLIWAVGNTIALFFQVVFYIVILQAVLTWIPTAQVTIQELLTQLSEPFMAPARRFIPLVGGLDLSPIAILIIIQILTFLIANPIMSLGLSMAS